MTLHTNLNLPKTNPFRAVYIGKHNGSTYRVAPCTIKLGMFRLDRLDIRTGWESNMATDSYPSATAAIAAFKALRK